MRERIIRYVTRIVLDEMNRRPQQRVRLHLDGRDIVTSIQKHNRSRGIAQ